MPEALPSVTEFSIDISKQEQPEPLPTGKYDGVIRAAEKKESQRGTFYAAVSFHIGADQFPADYKDGGVDGLTIIHRRVGLEDNLSISKGVLAKNNAEQVKKITQILQELSLDIATPSQARERLGLKGSDNTSI